MKFNRFLEEMKGKYDVKEISEGRYSVDGNGRSMEIQESNVYDPSEIHRFFEGRGDFGDVGRDDLQPFGNGIGEGKVKGSFVDPESSIFHGKKGSGDKNPMIKIDPITPSEKNKRGFSPDPDHLKKPDGGSGFPFERN